MESSETIQNDYFIRPISLREEEERDSKFFYCVTLKVLSTNAGSQT